MGTTFNRKHQTPFRQHLRTHGTSAEVLLWLNLKGRQFLGYKFRRQHGIGPYVVDLYCAKLRLAIEVDGESHQGVEAQYADRVRQTEIERHGIHVFRLTDDQILGNVELAVAAIEREVRRLSDHPPFPPPRPFDGPRVEEGKESLGSDNTEATYLGEGDSHKCRRVHLTDHSAPTFPHQLHDFHRPQ